MRSNITEEKMGGLVASWLQQDGWTVYSEVRVGYGQPRADIVARRGPFYWVIELKKSASLAVLDQVLNWEGKAHFVSIGTLPARPSRAFEVFCRDHGIGHIWVGEYESCTVRISPRLNRRPWIETWKNCLVEQQKDWGTAGNARHEYYTPFRQTCRELYEVVRRNPGIAFRDAMSRIKHHYHSDSTARSSMSQWLKYDKVPGVEMRREGRKIFLFLKEKSDAE